MPEAPPKVPTATVAPMDKQQDISDVSEVASDFQEDPFKNYRYEDPFMISDPFQNEEAPPTVFEGKLDIHTVIQVFY